MYIYEYFLELHAELNVNDRSANSFNLNQPSRILILRLLFKLFTDAVTKQNALYFGILHSWVAPVSLIAAQSINHTPLVIAMLCYAMCWSEIKNTD